MTKQNTFSISQSPEYELHNPKCNTRNQASMEYAQKQGRCLESQHTKWEGKPDFRWRHLKICNSLEAKEYFSAVGNSVLCFKLGKMRTSISPVSVVAVGFFFRCV